MTPNPLRHSLAALAALTALTACQAPGPTPASRHRDTGVRPVSTTLPADPTTASGADTTAITDRFAATIWPATVAYHYHPAQNGPEQLQWKPTIDPAITLADYTALRQAVQDLGVTAPDTAEQVSAGVADLQLATTRVGAATATDATVTACYTYTALRYTMESGYDPVRTPSAASADFALVYDDTWKLRAITDQHAVPGC